MLYAAVCADIVPSHPVREHTMVVYSFVNLLGATSRHILNGGGYPLASNAPRARRDGHQAEWYEILHDTPLCLSLVARLWRFVKKKMPVHAKRGAVGE